MSTEYLSFLLDVVDGWPPVGVECLPVRETPRGHEVLAAPSRTPSARAIRRFGFCVPDWAWTSSKYSRRCVT